MALDNPTITHQRPKDYRSFAWQAQRCDTAHGRLRGSSSFLLDQAQLFARANIQQPSAALSLPSSLKPSVLQATRHPTLRQLCAQSNPFEPISNSAYYGEGSLPQQVCLLPSEQTNSMDLSLEIEGLEGPFDPLMSRYLDEASYAAAEAAVEENIIEP